MIDFRAVGEYCSDVWRGLRQFCRDLPEALMELRDFWRAERPWPLVWMAIFMLVLGVVAAMGGEDGWLR